MKFKLKGLKDADSTSLSKFFNSIPNDTTELKLNGSKLYNKKIDDLIAAFKLIPSSVASLDLSENMLRKMHTDKLLRLITAIPQSITTINLRKNNLWHKSVDDLASVFAAFSPNVKKLILGENQFRDKKTLDLSIAFKALPESVIELNLCKSHLNCLSIKNLNQMKNSLPYIQTVILSQGEIERMTTKQRIALASSFPNLKKIIFLDNYNRRIAPSLEASLARTLGLTTSPPSLLQQVSFFVASNKNNSKLNESKIVLDNDTKDYVASAFSY
ncbi:hypothetical protein [Legionella gresilensis]|uniref:hypothetical protein n=1 Tax=Legionella gresilensis TaxID=91823 RepID=UPI0010415118|nr:hypothetical protein [Legionella gresilensis]